MRHQRTISSALLLGALLTGCGVEDSASPGGGDDTTDDGTGGGDDGTGDGSGSGGQDYSGDNNSGGPDMDDEGMDVMPTYPTAHPRIYISANKARLQAALTANTPAASRFRNTVDNWVNGTSYWGFSAWNAALLGPLTGDPKYCAKAVSVVDAMVASEEAKINSGTKPTVAGNSYLEVGPMIGDVALTYDWCFDTLSASQKTRWLKYANQAVWNVWHPTQAKWGSASHPWTGWSTNNPSDNYYYSFLRATMLLGLAAKGEDAQADGWITQFRDTKLIGQLVPTFDAQLRGGGSREGTAYGVSQRSLFHLYDLWQATTGEKLQAKTKHARQSLRSFMHQVVPTLDRFAPTGDQPRDHEALFFDYQRNYLQELIYLYPNDYTSGRAKTLLAGSNLPVMARPELLVYDFLYDNDVPARPLEEMATDYYASGIGQIYSRSGWDKQATWVNLTGGAYTESHAHQDQGSLMIYKGGWLAADAIFATSNGIVQDTTSHSLVRIRSGSGDIKQKVNTESKTVALHQGDGWLHAAVDTTAAYGGDANVSKVQREMVYLKPNVVVVYDRVVTGSGTSQIWQIASPIRPAISGATATIGGAHSLSVQRLAPASASSTATSLAGTGAYTGGFRLDTTVAGGDVRYLHVLSLDGGATSATASGDSTVTVNLAGGGSATVAFDRANIGATLTYNGTTTALAAGVDDIPE
jgi:hypothetical protein